MKVTYKSKFEIGDVVYVILKDWEAKGINSNKKRIYKTKIKEVRFDRNYNIREYKFDIKIPYHISEENIAKTKKEIKETLYKQLTRDKEILFSRYKEWRKLIEGNITQIQKIDKELKSLININ